MKDNGQHNISCRNEGRETKSAVAIPGCRIERMIHEGANSIVLHGTRDLQRQNVIVKLPKGEKPRASQLALFHREYELALRCSGRGAVRVLGLEKVGGNLAMIMEDFGGRPLNSYRDLSKKNARDLLAIAISTTQALRDIHDADISHQAVEPSNILWNPETGCLKFIDFGRASDLPAEMADMEDMHRPTCSPKYMSPEQTGRTNRLIDYRSDLYSLGMVLYGLFAGPPLLTAENTEKPVRAQRLEYPPPIRSINPDIPESISDIVGKLMSRLPEKRYRSAGGVEADLRFCLASLEKGPSIRAFEIGKQDASARMTPSSGLYGRQKEIERMEKAFEHVCDGGVEAVFISGPSGAGKTTLAHELKESVFRANGLYAEGKFDEFKRIRPCGPVLDALKMAAAVLPSQGAEKPSAGEGQDATATGHGDPFATQFSHDLEKIFETKPVLENATLSEVRAHCRLAFQNLARTFAKNGCPIFLFLDDLQWADSDSLSLVETIIETTELKNFMLVCAFRDDTADDLLPGKILGDKIETLAIPVGHMELTPMSSTQVQDFLRDAFAGKHKGLSEMAEVVAEKTRGIPLLIGQLAKSLHGKKAIRFEAEKKRWLMKPEMLESMDIPDNAANFATDCVASLPADTIDALGRASCLGDRFCLLELAGKTGRSPKAMFKSLVPALEKGLAIPVGHRYREIAAWPDDLESEQTGIGPVRFAFAHDSIRRASCFRMPDRQKEEFHFQAGMSLLELPRREKAGGDIFEIVRHLNSACGMVGKEGRQEEAARLNRSAGILAGRYNAPETAACYHIKALEYLSPDRWTMHRDSTRDICTELAECEYAAGRGSRSEKLLAEILEHTTSAWEKATVSNRFAKMRLCSGEYEEAVPFCKKALRHLGIEIPDPVDTFSIRKEIAKTRSRIGKRAPVDLFGWREAKEPDRKAALEAMTLLTEAASNCDSRLFDYLAARTMGMIAIRGAHALMPFNLAAFGVAMANHSSRLAKEGVAYGQAALKALENNGDKVMTSKTYLLLAGGLGPRFEQAAKSVELYETACHCGIESCAYACAVEAVSRIAAVSYTAGTPLESVLAEIEKRIAFVRSVGVPDALRCLLVTRQAIFGLMGETRLLEDFQNACFDEARFAEKFGKHPASSHALLWWRFLKMQILYLFGMYAEALAYADRIDDTIEFVFGATVKADYILHYCLALAAIIPTLSGIDKKRKSKTLGKRFRTLEKMEKTFGDIFLHQYLLLKAEITTTIENGDRACGLYEQAARAAGQSGHLRDKAYSFECAARYQLRRKSDRLAKMYIQEAYYDYLLWGAKAKADLLAKEHGLFLPMAKSALRQSYRVGAETVRNGISRTIDWASLLKASLSMSKEIELEAALRNNLEVMVECVGAQDALLCSKEDGKWKIEAAMGAYEYVPPSLENDSESVASSMPLKLLDFVEKKAETVVIPNVSNKSFLSEDPFFRGKNTKSILCMPMIHDSMLTAMIYLENNSAQGAFSPEKVRLLNMLASHGATSIHHARMFQSLRRSEEKFRRIAEDSHRHLSPTLSEGCRTDTAKASRPPFENTTKEVPMTKGNKGRTIENDAADKNARRAVRGAKVLLVEDSNINSRIAKEVLENAGLAVDTAANGKQAVEAVENIRYDAVLMDLQMPIMDGYEASELIRRNHPPNRLPIIAMGAEIDASLRQKCLNCGMNDFVGKPIDVSRLFSTLAATIQSIKQAEGSLKEIPSPKKKPFLSNDLDFDSALFRMNGNQKLLLDLLKEFCEMYAGSANQVRDCLESGNTEGAKRIVHTVKGAAANLSAHRLEMFCQELYERIDEAPFQSFTTMTTRFQELLCCFIDSVNKLSLD